MLEPRVGGSHAPFLSGEAFGELGARLEGVCADLGLVMKDDAAVRTVAKTIIQYAQQGIRDAATLRRMTRNEFAPAAETKPCDPALSLGIAKRRGGSRRARRQESVLRRQD